MCEQQLWRMTGEIDSLMGRRRRLCAIRLSLPISEYGMQVFDRVYLKNYGGSYQPVLRKIAEKIACEDTLGNSPHTRHMPSFSDGCFADR